MASYGEGTELLGASGEGIGVEGEAYAPRRHGIAEPKNFERLIQRIN